MGWLFSSLSSGLPDFFLFEAFLEGFDSVAFDFPRALADLVSECPARSSFRGEPSMVEMRLPLVPDGPRRAGDFTGDSPLMPRASRISKSGLSSAGTNILKPTGD